MKYCPGQNFIIKFNEILSRDDISYEMLSHGHYFIEDNILWYITFIRYAQSQIIEKLNNGQVLGLGSKKTAKWHKQDTQNQLKSSIFNISEARNGRVHKMNLLEHASTIIKNKTSPAWQESSKVKSQSRDFRFIFDEKWRSTLRLKYVGLQ